MSITNLNQLIFAIGKSRPKVSAKGHHMPKYRHVDYISALRGGPPDCQPFHF